MNIEPDTMNITFKPHQRDVSKEEIAKRVHNVSRFCRLTRHISSEWGQLSKDVPSKVLQLKTKDFHAKFHH